MSALKDRLLEEIKASPGRAVMLGAGLLVTLFVWGPHLKGMFQGKAGKRAPQHPATLSEVSPAAPATLGRDASVIRDEFISISREARALGRLANSPPPPTVERDPFDSELMRDAIQHLQAETTPDELEFERTRLEREAVLAMVLRGVVISGSRGTAMFEDQVVPVGARYRGFRVAELRINSVILAGELGLYELQTTRRDSGSALNRVSPTDGGEDQR